MSSDQWQTSLFDEARRTELRAIEEHEFQIRLKARMERMRANAEIASGRSDTPPGQRPSVSGHVHPEISDNQARHRAAHQTIIPQLSRPVAGLQEKPTIQEFSLSIRENAPKANTMPYKTGPVVKTIARGGPFKRSEPDSVFDDDRRRPLVTVKRSKSGPVVPVNTDSPEVDASSTVSTERPPKWYRELKRDNTRTRGDSNLDVLLVTLREWIRKAQKQSSPRPEVFDEVRGRIHKIAFLPATPKLIKKNWMLDNRDGLPLIFDNAYSAGVPWPWDIKADAEELYNKWCRGIFGVDLMRGILSQKFGNNKKGSERLDPDYKGRVSANYHGNGDLLKRAMVATRLTMLRDGAHGETQAGISGAEGKGAFACVMSGGLDHDGKEYPDEDHGDWILYCGTDNTSGDGKITSATQRMIESVGKEPVRLIRSSEVRSSFAPEIGYRYDGLYKVVSMARPNTPEPSRQRHRFKLERVLGQNPLRGGDGPEKRPTAEEIEAYQKMQKGLRSDSSI